MSRAIAIDMGATSARIAIGELLEGEISFSIHKQIQHHATAQDGVLRWDLESLLGLCQEAVALAESLGAASVAIDSWGVDHGFVDRQGKILGSPVCYRDPSHAVAYDQLKEARRELYAWTGIQHQPFNSICQLAARSASDHTFVKQVDEWMVLPDFLGFLLSGQRHHELTQASTTQLLGLNGTWSEEAFNLIGWPTPKRKVEKPGQLGPVIGKGVRLAHVGSHDTASAVAGFGLLGSDEVFLNVGTWSLMGIVLDQPLATVEAEDAGYTNERCVDARIRFLRNIPGFYIINRLHEELQVQESVPDWLRDGVQEVEGSIDLFSEEFFNPSSMIEACKRGIAESPNSLAGWAHLALHSLVSCCASQIPTISKLTGRQIHKIRVGGGGSRRC